MPGGPQLSLKLNVKCKSMCMCVSLYLFFPKKKDHKFHYSRHPRKDKELLIYSKKFKLLIMAFGVLHDSYLMFTFFLFTSRNKPWVLEVDVQAAPSAWNVLPILLPPPRGKWFRCPSCVSPAVPRHSLLSTVVALITPWCNCLFIWLSPHWTMSS